jgi:D-alanyl-D-alanine carboxypeptidase
MPENKYFLVCFCAIVLFAITIRQTNKKEALQVHENGPVLALTQAGSNEPDESIFLMDEIGDATTTPTAPALETKPKPYISAESYLVGNLKTGEIYIDHNSRQVFPIASISKLYTALVVEHLFKSDKDILITKAMLDAGYGDAGHLLIDEKFSAKELLYPLLLESSNDAAEAYAQSFGYEGFMEEMNGFAKEIGLKDTSFRDASGISPFNVSNVQDLFKLGQYLYDNEKDILRISSETNFDMATTSERKGHHFVNINPYAFYSGFIGGKTGRTDEAKESMISLFNQEAGSDTYPIAVIVLRAGFNEREIDTEKLIGMFVDIMKKR